MQAESLGIEFPKHSGLFLTIQLWLQPVLLVTMKLKQIRLPHTVTKNFLSVIPQHTKG
jgi:hypothetical protein